MSKNLSVSSSLLIFARCYFVNVVTVPFWHYQIGFKKKKKLENSSQLENGEEEHLERKELAGCCEDLEKICWRSLGLSACSGDPPHTMSRFGICSDESSAEGYR